MKNPKPLNWVGMGTEGEWAVRSLLACIRQTHAREVLTSIL